MTRQVKGLFVTLNDERFYKIENYDCMEDFFMTITSSSDIWNFCWAQGGITAGRVNADRALFPYYTADKLSDTKAASGSYSAVAVHKDGTVRFWEPFADLLYPSGAASVPKAGIQRNLYKNDTGTKVWFEEVNEELGLAFRYGWTSSARFGLVKMVQVENRSGEAQELTVLDGCRNIMPACTTADFQNDNSILLDAYKKTDLLSESNMAVFSVSSVVTDKAEPSEGLLANVCWFSTDDAVILSSDPIREFFSAEGNAAGLTRQTVLKGERASCFIARDIRLASGGRDAWYQVLDTSLTISRIVELQETVADRKTATRLLAQDIAAMAQAMEQYIADADGAQDTALSMTCIHHKANVMFNIMRGGLFANKGNIDGADFLAFVKTRNAALHAAAQAALAQAPHGLAPAAMQERIAATHNPQLERLLLEYLPLTFSRRHGDPSRPWNKFNIQLQDSKGMPLRNYEGNWRDIFQNWEALLHSYPVYIPQVCAKFVNAMTADGFNPYRISRDGLDWETPDPENPWAQYGYWGDHQVIYLQKLLELFADYDKAALDSYLNTALFSSANVPYRLKSYADICRNPRNSIVFDKSLSDSLIAAAQKDGTDKKLVQGDDGQSFLLTLCAKLLQIVIAKAANLVPGGGIWMNTQRPEWNDANNALAGWGLSVVTTCYLYRMLSFLIQLYGNSATERFDVPSVMADCFHALADIYKRASATVADNPSERKAFVDAAGRAFEVERDALYKNGYAGGTQALLRQELIDFCTTVRALVRQTIAANRRADGLYHTYNTLHITDSGMEIEHLQEMLEGQVAVLSSGLLSAQECLAVVQALRNSGMYERRQHSYMLYPNKELPLFMEKNTVPPEAVRGLADCIARTGATVLNKDKNGNWHFNDGFRNARMMGEFLDALPEQTRPTTQEKQELADLYERTFSHHSFTGRSGTFYAYEGLGSIYWHMVSKLLLAVQENLTTALSADDGTAPALQAAYEDIKQGLGFNKSPELYGAFPFDPYSHTPFGKGAKQPGMTGQVKEEILTRWGELGAVIKHGCASFEPRFLSAQEFFADGTLRFSWCGIPIQYHRGSTAEIRIQLADGTSDRCEGNQLPPRYSTAFFGRDGSIASLDVQVVA